MARQTHRKITKRNVKTLVAGGKLGVYWYATLPGFGIRLYASWGEIRDDDTAAGRK